MSADEGNRAGLGERVRRGLLLVPANDFTSFVRLVTSARSCSISIGRVSWGEVTEETEGAATSVTLSAS